MYFCFSIVNHDLFDSQEPMDENCYEQMKARPERSVNEPQEATPPARVSFVFCGGLVISYEETSDGAKGEPL